MSTAKLKSTLPAGYLPWGMKLWEFHTSLAFSAVLFDSHHCTILFHFNFWLVCLAVETEQNENFP